MERIEYVSYATVGCDPEGFLLHKGKVIGSEKVIPAKGIVTKSPNPGVAISGGQSAIVRDGIQIELHPGATTCRANLGNNIQAALKSLQTILKEHPEVTVSFQDVVEVSKRELETLSPESRLLGCMPSFNLYRPSRINVNPATYRKRSGGGHLHFSTIPYQVKGETDAAKDFQIRTIRMMDVLVGLPCVLIDRSPNAALRRRVYGRAGEYRLPSYGLEYRTLSNFWMHNYRLMSLVMALGRMAISAVYTTDLHRRAKCTCAQGTTKVFCSKCRTMDFEKEIYAALDMKKVVKAINKNDLELAQECWAVIREFIKKYFTTYSEGIYAVNLEDFEFFAKKIQDHAASGESKYHGLDVWFSEEPFQHWVNKPEGHGTGWETFCADVVRPMRIKEEALNKAKLLKEENVQQQ